MFTDFRVHGILMIRPFAVQIITNLNSVYSFLILKVQLTDLPIRHSYLSCHLPGQIRRYPKFTASSPGRTVNRRYLVSLLPLPHSHPSHRPGRPRSTVSPPASKVL
ncbi:hypothetical protein E2C01_060316 [Portunus trituberculatus]|uniref:Uncharacterized protein n=1 Tax=Portunus trituberculatus TaxID=210409 RepID=A0A5B7H250_PORTR|nr:hypothetical protein [Portunus trituberculatus]